MNENLTRKLAILEAKAELLGSVSNELTELADMQAFRQFRDELEEFITQKAAAKQVAEKPSKFVRSQIQGVEEVAQKIYGVCDSMLAVGDGPSGETRGSVSHSQLVARKESIEKAKSDLVSAQRSLREQFLALGIIDPNGAPNFHEDLAAYLLYKHPNSILLRQQPVSLHLANLHAFLNGQGPLQRAIQTEFQKKLTLCTNLLKLYEQQKEKLSAAQALCQEGKAQEANDLIKGIKKVFSDLDYSGIADSIKAAIVSSHNSMSPLERFNQSREEDSDSVGPTKPQPFQDQVVEIKAPIAAL